MTRLSLLCALLAMVLTLSACGAKGPVPLTEAEAATFTFTAENGETFDLPYRVHYPSGYKENGKESYPIMLFLHGHGECGTDNELQLMVMDAPNKFLEDVAALDQCIILAPQTVCDNATDHTEWIASGTGKEGKHQWDGVSPIDSKVGMPIRGGELEEVPYTIALQAASALLDEFLARDSVDKDRVYISGISLGGCGAWELAARRSDTFAALIPICGSGILSTADRLTDTAIWAFHGDNDRTVRPEGSTAMTEAILALGGNAEATVFEGVDHIVWDYAAAAQNAAGETPAQWMLAQSKSK